ncbi:unnamed protein product [Oikopleura dioica]|nr:unnamed protein product [Oikopleura dioica]
MFEIHYDPLLQFKHNVIDLLPKSFVHCNWLFREGLVGVPLRKGIILNAMEVNLDNIGAIVLFLATTTAYSAHAIKKLFFSNETEHQKKVYKKSDDFKSVKKPAACGDSTTSPAKDIENRSV